MIVNLRDCFERLRSFNLKLKPSKCEVGVTHIVQFGYEISRLGMTIDASRYDKLKLIKQPDTRKMLHSSLGAVNYYRDVIPDFAKFMIVLTPLLSEKVKFVWEKKHTEAWNGLIKSMQNA